MKPKLNSTVWLLIVGNGFAKMASIMSMPFLAIFLSKERHFSSFEIGMIIASSPIAALFGAFLGGQASDIFGRSKVLFSTLFMLMSTFFGFYFSSKITVAHYQTLFFVILNLLAGFCSSVFAPVSQALIADLTPAVARPKAFQLRYAAINIGAAIGPALGGFAGISSTPSAFLVTGILYSFYFIYLFIATYGKIPENHHANRVTFSSSTQAVLKDVRLRHLILSGILFMGAYSQVESTLSQALAKTLPNGVQVFSLLLSLNGLLVIAFQAPVYWLIQKMPAVKSLILGTLIFSVGELVFAFSHSQQLILILGMLFVSIGEIFVFPVSSQFIDEIAPSHFRGTYFGANNFRQIGLVVGPPLGGILLDHFGIQGLFLVTTFAALASAAIHFIGETITKEETHGTGMDYRSHSKS